MNWGGIAAGALAGAVIVTTATPMSAQVRDAVYRGTLVCDKLPFSAGKGREAIEVTIAGDTVRYSHVVRLRDAAEPVPEQGKGSLRGQDIELQGSWKSGDRQYEAKYGGTPISRGPKPGRTAVRISRAHAPVPSSGRSGSFCRVKRSRAPIPDHSGGWLGS